MNNSTWTNSKAGYSPQQSDDVVLPIVEDPLADRVKVTAPESLPGGIELHCEFQDRRTSVRVATTLGAFMSICAVLVTGVLFLSQTWTFASSGIVTSIAVDENTSPQIRLNFNVTFLDLHCDFVSVDVWDALGTNRQNVTENVNKWQLDDEGRKRVFSGRNRELHEVAHEQHDKTLEQLHALHAEGVHVVDLKKNNFDKFLEKNDMAFVDFYYPWSVACQRLAPTWEKFAQEAKTKNMPVGVGRVDCMAETDLCRDQRIMTSLTLRWYHVKEKVSTDYKRERTVDALLQFAKSKLEMDEKFKAWEEKANPDGDEREKKHLLYQQHRPEHPGCQVSGHLMVNRVPGNFHIEAKSKNFNLNAAKTNLSHIVHHLSFGDPIDENNRRSKRILKQVLEEHGQFSPMDGQSYITKDFHQAYHHYIKVVSTHLNMGSSNSNSMSTYHLFEQSLSQVVFYDVQNIPEARFSYDFSPLSVVVAEETRQ